MYNKIVILLFLILFSVSCQAQIIAGDSANANVLYIRVDTTLVLQYSQTKSAYYDVDSDGIKDLRFDAYSSGGLGADFNGVLVYTLNNNTQLAVFPSNTTWADTVHPGSVIGSSLTWLSSSSNFYLNYSGFYHTNYPPYTNYVSYGVYGCCHKYLGFRKIINSDTLYGWFRLDSVSAGRIIIKSFAIQKTLTDFTKFSGNNTQTTIYPNPTAKAIIVEANTQIIQIKLYDLLGKEVIDTQEKNIEVSNLSEGVYFLKIKFNDGVLTKKLIIQR